MGNSKFNLIIGLMVVVGVALIIWSLAVILKQTLSPPAHPLPDELVESSPSPAVSRIESHTPQARQTTRKTIESEVNLGLIEANTAENHSADISQEEMAHPGDNAKMTPQEENAPPTQDVPAIDPNDPERLALLAELAKTASDAEAMARAEQLPIESLRSLVQAVRELIDRVEQAKRAEEMEAAAKGANLAQEAIAVD